MTRDRDRDICYFQAPDLELDGELGGAFSGGGGFFDGGGDAGRSNSAGRYVPDLRVVYQPPERSSEPREVRSCTASELARAETVSADVDLSVLDVRGDRLFHNPALSTLVSLDASRIGIEDSDLCELARSRCLGALRWLSLAGNNVSAEGVRSICQAIRERRLNLLWLDLRGTGFDATPYLDGDDGERAYWRLPRASVQLREEFGLQTWMTLGRPLDKEDVELIHVSWIPPDRLTIR